MNGNTKCSEIEVVAGEVDPRESRANERLLVLALSSDAREAELSCCQINCRRAPTGAVGSRERTAVLCKLYKSGLCDCLLMSPTIKDRH